MRGRLTIKLGLFHLFSNFGNVPQDQLFNEVLDEIGCGEELGFDSAWLPERRFAIYGMLILKPAGISSPKHVEVR